MPRCDGVLAPDGWRGAGCPVPLSTLSRWSRSAFMTSLAAVPAPFACPFHEPFHPSISGSGVVGPREGLKGFIIGGQRAIRNSFVPDNDIGAAANTSTTCSSGISLGQNGRDRCLY